MNLHNDITALQPDFGNFMDMLPIREAYNSGFHCAQYRAGELAIQTDAIIEALEAELLDVYKQLAESRNQLARPLEALHLIAHAQYAPELRKIAADALKDSYVYFVWNDFCLMDLQNARMEIVNNAVDVAYPITDNPHASVQYRNEQNRKVFREGYLAACNQEHPS